MNVSFEEFGIDKCIKDIYDSLKKWKMVKKRRIKLLAAEYISEVKARTPVVTGLLRNSWQAEQIVENKQGVSVKIVNEVIYGLSVEFRYRRFMKTRTDAIIQKRFDNQINSDFNTVFGKLEI